MREVSSTGDDTDLERAHVATVERAEVLHNVPLYDALGLRLRSRLALTKGSHGVVIARMQKEIKIACKGAAEMELQTLVPMQGDLKDLSEENYEKLKKEIIELGFSEPISVWIDPEGQAKLLNGHQRTRVLHKMRDDGWVIPPLPVSIVEAESHQQAMKKILSLTSQYGEITKDGLYKFMNEAQLSMDEVAASFRFPEIKFDDFKIEFYNGEPSLLKDDTYTKKIEAPVYEPRGEKPAVTELCDLTKTLELTKKIQENESISDEIKMFLKLAAQRHTVFNYEKIAEFYAHADAETQNLMEDSALVIIDFKKAIENGFVIMSEEIAKVSGPNA